LNSARNVSYSWQLETLEMSTIPNQRVLHQHNEKMTSGWGCRGQEPKSFLLSENPSSELSWMGLTHSSQFLSQVPINVPSTLGSQIIPKSSRELSRGVVMTDWGEIEERFDNLNWALAANPAASGRGEVGQPANKPGSHFAKMKNFNSLGPRLKKTYLDKQWERDLGARDVKGLPPPPLGWTIGHDFLGWEGLPKLDVSQPH